MTSERSTRNLLASLLVRDEVIQPRKMEEAFQRQVIHGGSLDTVLLEMELIDERRLTGYLGRAMGMAPGSTNLLDHVDPSAQRLIPGRAVVEKQVIPVRFDGA